MRQPRPQVTVRPRSCQGGDDRRRQYTDTGPDQRAQRPRARTHGAPADPDHRPASNIAHAAAERLRWKRDPPPLELREPWGRDREGGGKLLVQVETFEAEGLV